jgi:hypothetical protein
MAFSLFYSSKLLLGSIFSKGEERRCLGFVISKGCRTFEDKEKEGKNDSTVGSLQERAPVDGASRSQMEMNPLLTESVLFICKRGN